MLSGAYYKEESGGVEVKEKMAAGCRRRLFPNSLALCALQLLCMPSANAASNHR